MNLNRKPSLSAPGCQLSEVGTSMTQALLLSAARTLSDAELEALEDDLAFFDETGLVGRYMSRLLAVLQAEGAIAAA